MQEIDEIFVPMLGYEGRYEISNYGRIKSLCGKVAMIRKQQTNRKGYCRIWLSNKGKYKFARVHRLVLLSFKGGPPEGMEYVNHIDGDKSNNCLDNLEWVSHKSNIRHAITNGLIDRAFQKHPLSKAVHQLDPETNEIVKTYYSAGQAARAMGVHNQTIRNVAGKKKNHLVCGYKWVYAESTKR